MSNFVLSEDTRIEIRKVLKKTKKIEPEQMDDAIWCIDASLVNAEILEESGKSQDAVSELKALHKSIVRLLRTIRDLSVESKLALDDCVSEWDNEQNHSTQISGLPRQSGERLDKLQIYAEIIEKAAAGARLNIRVKRGAPINFSARAIALHLRESLEDFDIEITTTDKGPYMAIVRAALSELIPTDEGEAYRRHGLWAIRVTDISEVDWASMTVDSKR